MPNVLPLLREQEIYPRRLILQCLMLIKLNDEPVTWNTDYKYLGIHLDSKLSWCKHNTKTLCHINSAVGFFDPVLAWNSLLSFKNRLLLYNSMSWWIITYGLVVYGSPSKTHLEKIQIFQKKINYVNLHE